MNPKHLMLYDGYSFLQKSSDAALSPNAASELVCLLLQVLNSPRCYHHNHWCPKIYISLSGLTAQSSHKCRDLMLKI